MSVKGDDGDDGHAPPRRTQGERRAATRAALIAAGRELFAQKGFAGAGREEIVERAGVTRGAMYHHFDSKEALFQAVYEEVEEEVLAHLMVAAAPGPRPEGDAAARLARLPRHRRHRRRCAASACSTRPRCSSPRCAASCRSATASA